MYISIFQFEKFVFTEWLQSPFHDSAENGLMALY